MRENVVYFVSLNLACILKQYKECYVFFLVLRHLYFLAKYGKLRVHSTLCFFFADSTQCARRGGRRSIHVHKIAPKYPKQKVIIMQ